MKQLIGAESLNSVHVYDDNGFVGNMAPLNIGRRDHACGFYIDNNNNEVKIFMTKDIQPCMCIQIYNYS